MITVEMPDGTHYIVKRLLTQPAKMDMAQIAEKLATGNYPPKQENWLKWWHNRGSMGGNNKLQKGQKIDYTSVGLSLAPNKESGYSVCPNTTPGCTRACIYNGGISEAFKQLQPAQIAKTRALFQHRDVFDQMLLKELQAFARKHEHLVCRLNVYSDLPWERMTPWLFEKLPAVHFYDYTKVPARMFHYLDGHFPKNYHLTFSRSEVNDGICEKVLAKGGSIAVVFPAKQFPEKYLGYPVIDGDENDLRFTDPDPCVVGLKAKNRFGRSDNTGFVVRIPLEVV